MTGAGKWDSIESSKEEQLDPHGGGATMDPLIVKFVEVLMMQVLVFGAVVAILVAAVWDVVQAKVRESRHQDRIAPNPATHHFGGWFARHHIHNPLAHRHV
jgi:hypothetical protein